jgi:hypothetical protein
VARVTTKLAHLLLGQCTKRAAPRWIAPFAGVFLWVPGCDY